MLLLPKAIKFYWRNYQKLLINNMTRLISESLHLFQINFFQDHTKIILCPLMQAVTYIDEKRDFHVFKLSGIEKYGCTRELASRLRYARTMVERLMTSKSGSGRVRSANPSTSQPVQVVRFRYDRDGTMILHAMTRCKSCLSWSL